jgi:hypothetical protein
MLASNAMSIVSALKNHYMWGFLEAPVGVLNRFWVQVAVSLLKPAARRLQKRNGRYVAISEMKRLKNYSG